MGDPKKRKKQYKMPKKIWDKSRLENEKRIVETYGLKNKRELWKVDTQIKSKRKNARDLLALKLDERIKREKELVESFKKIGLLNEKATLEDVLSLSTEALLERRLQTIVLRKGLANTVTQARQFIVHGHIAVNGKKVSRPSYLVEKSEEGKISYYGKPIKLQTKQPKFKRELKKAFEAALPKSEKAEMIEEAVKAESSEKMENETAEIETAIEEEKK